MDEQQVENELDDTQPEHRGGPWKAIIIVIIATLIGVWLVPGDDESPGSRETVSGRQAAPSLLEPVAPATDATRPPDTAPASAPDIEQAPATAAGEPAESGIVSEVEEPVDTSPGARARALIAEMRGKGEVRVDAVFDAANQAQADGELADAYLLYFFAAREGHGGAALTLGQQADPATRDPASSVFESADLTQAHKWYQIAAQNGNDEGRSRLADLRKRVEEMAANGDPQAQRVALLWQ